MVRIPVITKGPFLSVLNCRACVRCKLHFRFISTNYPRLPPLIVLVLFNTRVALFKKKRFNPWLNEFEDPKRTNLTLRGPRFFGTVRTPPSPVLIWDKFTDIFTILREAATKVRLLMVRPLRIKITTKLEWGGLSGRPAKQITFLRLPLCIT